MTRNHVSTGTPWEEFAGYARAVQVGPHIHVAGTTATDEHGTIVAAGDPYGQTVQVIRNIQAALQALGADLECVVRTRIYVTDIDNWQEVARAHGEFFHDIRPASTLVAVSGLVDPAMLVEIDADGLLPPE